MFLIFDTETTGLPKKWNAPLSDSQNWPRCIQLAWQLHDSKGKLINNNSCLIKPDGFDIPFESQKVHGISTDLAKNIGLNLDQVIKSFLEDLKRTKYLVGHNVKFDINIIGAELYRLGISSNLSELKVLDTCTESTANLCKIKGGKSGKFKYPTLVELYDFIYKESFTQAHNASADVEATARSFFELVRTNIFSINDFEDFESIKNSLNKEHKAKIPPYGINHLNLKNESKKIKDSIDDKNIISNELSDINMSDNTFVHLHNNSQFSVLQSTSRIADLVKKTAELNMLSLIHI